jgi:hypothetical protein
MGKFFGANYSAEEVITSRIPEYIEWRRKHLCSRDPGI